VKKDIDYSSDPSLGSAEPKGAAQKKTEKDEEPPTTQTRSSSRARKSPVTFLDEANAKLEPKKRGGKSYKMYMRNCI